MESFRKVFLISDMNGLFVAILETIIDLSSYDKEDDVVPGLSPLALTKDKVTCIKLHFYSNRTVCNTAKFSFDVHIDCTAQQCVLVLLSVSVKMLQIIWKISLRVSLTFR